ncbi:hypothetical protein AB0M22_43800 [Nocardia sp. NPDC051756]|uniref:hypothetical protein n=1 Tax=Nocardia sp. NPDC051756 TaxID=3154751 RepID=UPI00344869D3
MEHQQEEMSSSTRGRRGARRGVFIAASLVGVSALGYSMVGTTQPIASAADDSAPYTCTIPDTKIKVTTIGDVDEGSYELEVPETKLSGDNANCTKLAKTTIPVEDNRPSYDGTTSGKCVMKIDNIIATKNFENGGGTIKAALDGSSSDLMATADTTAASPQKETSAELTAKFKGLKWTECKSHGFTDATITMTGGKIKFTPK